MTTPIPELISLTRAFVAQYMSTFDPSHDFNHVLRVLSLSHHLLSTEKSHNPQIPYDADIVTLAALLHDVGDKKYLPPSAPITDSAGPVELFLLSVGAEKGLAERVQKIVDNVSYSHEVKNLEAVRAAIGEYPELAVVQDADRLDAIGAVGVGRTFMFGAAKRGEEGMVGVIRHFEEKLLKLPEMMKTVEGRRMGEERGERIRVFREWWMLEMGDGGEGCGFGVRGGG
ncbi:hypothetical protein RUND412_003867 [Rhizina undulata]